MARSARKAEVQKLELTWAGELHQRGLREGRVASARSMLEKILTRRFGTLTPTFAARVRNIDDLDLIDRLSDLAFEVSDVAEIERELAG